MREALKEKVRKLPDTPGVYMMKDRFGTILYVGKAKRLKRRVSSYFQPSRKHRLEQPKVVAMIDLIHDLQVIEVKSEAEALLLEGRLIKEWRPKYNTMLTDDKRFLLVRLDMNKALPTFRLSRLKTNDQDRYFGPFAHSSLLRKTLHEMRRKFGVLLGDTHPLKIGDNEWKLYDDVRAEIYTHENIVTKESYAERIEAACEFLEGKSRKWLEDLKEEMIKASEDQRYEKAAELRDIVFALEKTLKKVRTFTVKPPLLKKANGIVLDTLQKALQMKKAPESIECFDISHVSGSYCVASMVRFENGLPANKKYRRFKIKSFIGNDDFRAMEEVVGRRYKRLHDEEKPFPDLVVIDGGAGQVGAALKAFWSHELQPPTLIGLAKKEETIIFSDGREPLILPRRNDGLRLLQRVRDEAHRFANTFNADLRSKKIRQSILDDFEGLGPVKRKAIWEHFQTLEKLRKASEDDLMQVEGIGPKLASRLYEYLSKQKTKRLIQPL